MKWDGKGIWLDSAYQLPGLGLRKGVLDKRPMDEVSRIVIHHTGVGVLGRYKRQKDRFGWDDPLQAANHVYTRIMKASGHFCIGYGGEVVQYVPLDYSAWHAGYGNKRRRSRRGEWFDKWRYSRKDKRDLPLWLTYKRYNWWMLKWYAEHGYTSPLQWFPTLDTNGTSIGIEILSTPGKEPFHEAQLNALHDLLTYLCQEYGIPLDRDHVLTHSDICPLARTTRGGEPWDPPPQKIDPFLDSILKPPTV